jgi:hypothetical protein
LGLGPLLKRAQDEVAQRRGVTTATTADVRVLDQQLMKAPACINEDIVAF